MTKKIRTGGIVIVISAAIVVLAAYLIYRNERDGQATTENCETCHLDSNLEKKPVRSTQSAGETRTPTDLNYVNDNYGFELSLTEVWKSSQIKEEESSGALKKIVFYFETKDKNYESSNYLAPALTIYVYDKDKWESGSLESQSGVRITSSDKYVFSYAIWDSPPQDLEYITEKELSDVITTFKLKS